VGTLNIGAQADITLINPEMLNGYNCDENRQLVYRDLFEHKQMVNRPDGIVSRVLIRGETVWKDNNFAEALGSKPLGRALRAA
jgi:hypothetical protein